MTSSVAGDGDRSARRLALGRRGEDLAAEWYESRGYQVLDRNWSCRSGELDIIAYRALVYVFCEVKARSSATFGYPAEAVGYLKQARVRRLAAAWLAAQRGPVPLGGANRQGCQVRFDVASVMAGAVDVIEGAF
jgi:putative endonuclease